MKFSQRVGQVKVGKIAQLESIDQDLKNGLWNAVTKAGFRREAYVDYAGDTFFRDLWEFFFKLPLDEISKINYRAFEHVKMWYFEGAEWYEQYDFIEFIVNRRYSVHSADYRGLIKGCDYHLDKENSAYRFIAGQLTPITSPEEIQEIESALTDTSGYSGVKTHLTSALSLMNDRENPDYRNSIKESISAVEGLVKIIGGDEKATLGAALKALEGKNSMHPALNKAFSILYGYTNDANGIRHALLDGDSQSNKAEARFMLIACSAFVNYSKSIISSSHI
jgi:hypothetical protein